MMLKGWLFGGMDGKGFRYVGEARKGLENGSFLDDLNEVDAMVFIGRGWTCLTQNSGGIE